MAVVWLIYEGLRPWDIESIPINVGNDSFH